VSGRTMKMRTIGDSKERLLGVLDRLDIAAKPEEEASTLRRMAVNLVHPFTYLKTILTLPSYIESDIAFRWQRAEAL
jgi:hypothetical protein